MSVERKPVAIDEDPIVVAVALDAETTDVLAAACELARRMRRPIVAVHSVCALIGEPREQVAQWVEQAQVELEERAFTLRESGVTVLDAVVGSTPPHRLVVDVARALRAHMIVTGGGGPATVRRWVLGSTAEKIVRASPVPVFVFRGTLPGPNQFVLCPVGESREARLGLAAAVRMTRLFEAQLRVLRVIAPEARGWLDAATLDREVERELGAERTALDTFLTTLDLGPVHADARVVVGEPAERIVEASEDAGLLVLSSHGFEHLVPGSLPTIPERSFRFARPSALCINDLDVIDEAHEERLRHVAELKIEAAHLLADGRAMRALPLLQEAAGQAPADAAIQESLAAALYAVGRVEEARARVGLARAIRGSYR